MRKYFGKYKLPLTMFLFVLVGSFFIGCQPVNIHRPAPQDRELTQLEWRQLQTRYFSMKDVKSVSQAVVGALQDENYIIATYSKDIGLITAYKEENQMDEATRRWRTGNLQNGWQTVRKTEASCVVSEQKEGEYKVRINLIEKGISDTGGVLWSQSIHTPGLYQAIFSKIDKSIFLKKENL